LFARIAIRLGIDINAAGNEAIIPHFLYPALRLRYRMRWRAFRSHAVGFTTNKVVPVVNITSFVSGNELTGL